MICIYIIRFDKGEFQFDGIEIGDSDMDDLTAAQVEDKSQGKMSGWTTLVTALESTGASPSLYGRWNKKHKKGDWASLMYETDVMSKLKEIYEDPSQPGAFSSIQSLYAEGKKRGIKTTKNEVADWLGKRLSYTLHKPVRKRFKRNKTIVFL